MSELVLDKSNFPSEVEDAKGVVLIDFFATWCGPCQMQLPIIEELAKEYAGKAKVGKLDVDQSMDIAQKYAIMSIPTIIIFKDGNPAERLNGLQQKDILKTKLDKALL